MSASRSGRDLLLQPALLLSRMMSVVARRRNSLGRLLLKGMNHPDVLAQLQRIDDAIGIAALLDRQFADARTKPGEQLGDVRHPTIDDNGKGVQSHVDSPMRTRIETLLPRLDPSAWK